MSIIEHPSRHSFVAQPTPSKLKALPAVTLTLPAALYGFVVLGAVFFAFAAGTLVMRQVHSYQRQALEEAVTVRTRGAATVFGRALDRDWTYLQATQSIVPMDDSAALKVALTALSGTGERITWAGYATIDGTVVASSRGLLEGVDVSQRPWFQRGLEGPYAGDVQDAVLLNNLLGGTEEDPLRFIDLAGPVTGLDGNTTGVLGFHINFDWAEDFLTEVGDSLGIDLYLVNPIGEVIIATDSTTEGQLDLASLRAASAGAQISDFEIWPNGRRYFTTVVPRIAHRTLPSIGWRMVGRIDPATAAVPGAGMTSAIVTTLAGAGLALLLLSVIFARIFLVPLAAMARNAERLADGKDDYPIETRRTSELARLSAALARLQAQRG